MALRRCRVVALTLLLALGAACGDDDSNDNASKGSDTEAAGATTSSIAEVGAPENGELFSDPQGAYDLRIDPDWEANHGSFVAEVEVWFVGEPEDGFAPNVNVLTQQVGDADLTAYLDLSIDGAEQAIEDFRLVSREQRVGDRGDDLGVLDYYGSQDGRQFRFLQVIAVDSGQAIVATLTVPEGDFAGFRGEVEPYLLTLHAT